MYKWREVISKDDNTEMLQSLLEMEFYGERDLEIFVVVDIIFWMKQSWLIDDDFW